MRQGFTLIELMIVIAIIAIIAAIAIPNLLESRITANEAAASASLKSGMFPAQVQYQTGTYVDVDSDGRGIYAPHVAYLSGAVGTAAALGDAPTKVLSLMDGSFNNTNGAACAAQATTYTTPTMTNGTQGSNKGAYDFYCFISNSTNTINGVTISAEDSAENYWSGVACPHDVSGTAGRRAFAIGANGSLYQSKGTLAQTSTTIGNITAPAAGGLILGEITTTAAGVSTALARMPVNGQATTTANSSIYQK